MRSKPDRVSGAIAVYVEFGKKAIAGALDWPGWCRVARNEGEAIAALVAYGDRYRAVVEPAVATFAPPKDPSELRVVRRLKGNATTDFGAPAMTLSTDDAPISAAELDRMIGCLEACWAAFDRAAKAAKGHELRKGPRGGGRDLDKIVGHVTEAEQGYTVALGARLPKPVAGRSVDPRDQRTAIVAAIRARAHGRAVTNPSAAKRLWSPRFFVRRAAWHVLDHTWEIEDRVV